MRTFEQSQEAVIAWAKDKGILDSSTPKDQYIKFIEEAGELAAAIARGDEAEAKDAIGDVLVTVILQAELMDIDPIAELSKVVDIITKRTGKMVDGVFVKDN
jgi:NTP pyrophosphatase (non-canonical NTP hydrolase)